MYLKKTPTKSGRVSLSIVKGFRDAEGRVRQRTVRTVGFLDELEREWDDPVAHFRAVAEEMSAAEAEEAAPVTVEIHPLEKIDARSANRKSAGAAPILAVYDALGVEKALRNSSAGSRAGYDLNACCRLLVAERALAPGSKLAAVEGKGRHFFRCDLTDDDLYRSLDAIAAARDRVVSAMNRSIERGFGRDRGNVFYDVTNYWFERDPDEAPEGLLKRGVSKEKRPDPIVQMGLLQDADGVPISYRLFPGNTQDSQTMLPVLADMKRDLGLQSVTAVADKGLNCSENMAALVASGDGFVFSQSIRGTKSDVELRRWVLDPRGYRGSGDGDSKRKSRQGHKACHLKAADTASGRAEDVELDVKYVAMWSRKYAERARHEREAVLERARELVASPGAYTAHRHYGAARYVKGIAVDAKTGEVLDCAEALSLDEEAVKAEEALDGYYLIVTSRTGWPDEEVVAAYRGLWQIEESFKATKSDLEARPVYVRTPAHIEAHFLTCYIALTILRLLQKVCPGRPSTGSICRELALVECSALEDGWWLFDHRSTLTEDLFRSVGLQHPTKYMRTSQIKALFKKGVYRPKATTGNAK